MLATFREILAQDAGDGVVLAEAHGSFTANASAKSVHLQSKNKYLRQVKPYLAMSSPYGKMIHGYSIAFGSKPAPWVHF